MNEIFDRLKNVSTHNRQRIIEIMGLDLELQQVMIAKYCRLMSRDEMAQRFNTSVDNIDRKLNIARNMFITIYEHEYSLFGDDQKELLDLIKNK